MKTIIKSNEAPEAIGAYSQACQVGNQVFFSGQIGLDPKTGNLVADGVSEQLEQAILNLKAVATAANMTLKNIVKLNVYLLDMQDFAIVNTLIEKYFAPNYPARAAVAVSALPKGSKIEIDAIACKF